MKSLLHEGHNQKNLWPSEGQCYFKKNKMIKDINKHIQFHYIKFISLNAFSYWPQTLKPYCYIECMGAFSCILTVDKWDFSSFEPTSPIYMERLLSGKSDKRENFPFPTYAEYTVL